MPDVASPHSDVNSSSSPFDDESHVTQLRAWFGREPGSLVAAVEQRMLSRILPDLFGYHLVQLGCHHDGNLLDSSRISHRVLVELGHEPVEGADMQCVDDALPLASGSVDVLVLPHVLEFSADPRRVLREAERVLIGEGHIVVIGFNPWSLQGVWSLLLRWQEQAPWSGRYVSSARVTDWLQLLGFDIVHCARGSFRPPVKSARLNERFAFLEKLGGYCWPVLGNVFVVVGRKRVEGVTPLKVSWKQRRRVAAGVVEPTMRGPTTRGR